MNHVLVEVARSSSSVMGSSFSSFIESTRLHFDITSGEVEKLCEEALALEVHGVCIPSYHVQTAVRYLGEEREMKVITTIGFPMGYNSTLSKIEEAKRAFAMGADEIDMVINMAALKSGNWKHVRNDIESLSTTANMQSKICKVIVEPQLLDNEELARVCEILKEKEVHFFKTNTGFFPGSSASLFELERVNKFLDPSVKVKVSGGIKTKADALALIEAGATRIGTSSASFLLT